MAEKRIPWRDAIDQALEANERADNGRPTTLYGLGTALAADPRSRQNAESWRSWIKVVRRGGTTPKEDRASLLADALGVPRDSLPDAEEKLSLRILADRLAALEAVVADLPTTEDMRRGLDKLRVAIDTQASPGIRRDHAEDG